MIKSFATFARIHWPLEYKEYLDEKAWTYSAHNNRKRVRQVIKAIIINGGKEYKFEDWSREQDEYHRNFQWQADYGYAETY
mgnify:CR=1 FL=1